MNEHIKVILQAVSEDDEPVAVAGGCFEAPENYPTPRRGDVCNTLKNGGLM